MCGCSGHFFFIEIFFHQWLVSHKMRVVTKPNNKAKFSLKIPMMFHVKGRSSTTYYILLVEFGELPMQL